MATNERKEHEQQKKCACDAWTVRGTDCRDMSECVCGRRREALQRRRGCMLSIRAHHTVRSADAFTEGRIKTGILLTKDPLSTSSFKGWKRWQTWAWKPRNRGLTDCREQKMHTKTQNMLTKYKMVWIFLANEWAKYFRTFCLFSFHIWQQTQHKCTCLKTDLSGGFRIQVFKILLRFSVSECLLQVKFSFPSEHWICASGNHQTPVPANDRWK